MGSVFENTVYVVSGDSVFARMLELELCDSGIDARRVDGLNQCGGGVTVVDSETVQKYGVARFEHLVGLVEFGFSETSEIEGAVYFRRPFPVDGFVCQVKAMLGDSEAKEKAPTFDSSAESPRATVETGLVYDAENNAFFYNGEIITLTETEHALLSLLYEKRGETVTREEILHRVWGRDGEVDTKTNLTDVYVRYLREKLDDRFSVKLILAVRGKGYTLKN